MSAAIRRLRIPSSGPFVDSDAGGRAPEVGEGSEGIIYRYRGASSPQTWLNAGPFTQNFNFRDYDNAGDTDTPLFPTPLVVPFWLDFEFLGEFTQLGTTDVTAALYMTHQSGEGLIRQWTQFSIGSSESLQCRIVDRAIYLPDIGDPDRLFSRFRFQLTIAADAGDVIMNNPQCFAKLQTYMGPVAP